MMQLPSNFFTHRLELRRIEVVCRPSQLLKIDVRADSHLAGVYLQDLGAGLLIGVWELYLAVEPACNAQQGRVRTIKLPMNISLPIYACSMCHIL